MDHNDNHLLFFFPDNRHLTGEKINYTQGTPNRASLNLTRDPQNFTVQAIANDNHLVVANNRLGKPI